MIQVVWTAEAEKTLDQNLQYLESNWNLKVINNFLDRVDHTINLISEHPLMYPTYKEFKDIRKAPVTKQIILYYKVSPGSIELLSFWNAFQNPTSMSF
ncbi:MAG: type II toxin-antitoxin system RelE/ParE family toxin [Cyclobacteriaceae bacterium]